MDGCWLSWRILRPLTLTGTATEPAGSPVGPSMKAACIPDAPLAVLLPLSPDCGLSKQDWS